MKNKKSIFTAILLLVGFLPLFPFQNKIHIGIHTVSAEEYAVDRAIYFASIEYDVDPFLIKSIIKAESNFDPFAVSPKGAMGLMQLMPGTARDLGVEDPFDPDQNVFGGTKFIRDLLQRYEGDIVLALAAYNAGPAKVKDRVPDYPETQQYIQRVSRNYKRYLLN